MNISVVRHSIRNRGGDRLVLDYLAYLVKHGHTITYWTNEVNTHFAIDPKIEIRKIPFPGILGTILFTLFTAFKTEVVLVDLVVTACFASLRNKTKILYLAQDYDISYHKSKLIKAFVGLCYQFVLHTMGVRTISVSQGLAEKLQQYHPKHLSTISNGVNLNFFVRDQNLRFSTKKDKSFSILLFAREDYRKGLDIAKKSLEHLRQLRPQPDWEVWTIGSEKIELPGITIKNWGLLKSDEDMKAVLSAADIYLVPSRSEGLSLLLLQAIACQCAIVTTAASTIIQHECDGLVSPIEDWKSLADHLNRVLGDADLRKKLMQHSRLLAEEYSLDKSCRKFEKELLFFVPQHNSKQKENNP